MNNCSRHKKEIAGISDMKVLAEMIGDLHYESLFKLFGHLCDKLHIDSVKDFNEGRTELANQLSRASVKMFQVRNKIKKAWQISKPFMIKQKLSIMNNNIIESSKIKISEQDKKLVSVFMDEEYPGEIDFNWLMPVWGKILLLNMKETDDMCIREPWRYMQGIRNALCEGELKIVFQKIVEFIEWYNIKIKNHE